MSMADVDTEEGEFGPTPERQHFLFGPDASFDMEFLDLWFMSDYWAHGILLDAESGFDGSAVESASWGRIKASLSE